MSAIEVDTTRLPLLLHDLRLPAIARLWPEFAERADKEGWPAARFLAALAELEIAERGRRRTERNLAEARLLAGKTLDNFDFSVVPMLSKARVMALAAGDTWLDKATNLLLFGPPGTGKSHCASALGRALIENGFRVLFTRTTDIVQKLQAARQALQLEAAITKLDKYQLLILDDLSYVHKDHAETSVLFELIGARYERRSMLITANQPFADWNKVFPDHAMMIAAIDRLIHHSIIFEMNVESYRRRGALERKNRAPTTPSRTAKETTSALIVAASDNQRATIKNIASDKQNTCQRQSAATIMHTKRRSQNSILIDALSHPVCRANRTSAPTNILISHRPTAGAEFLEFRKYGSSISITHWYTGNEVPANVHTLGFSGAAMTSSNPAAELVLLVTGYRVSQAIHVAATLGIADLIKDGASSASDLAVATNSHAGALYRVLRALAAAGVFHEDDEKRFSLTPLGECLRSDAERPMAAWASFIGRPHQWQAWGSLSHSVRTGENAYRHVHGVGLWDYLVGHPEEAAIFDRAMTGGSRGVVEAIVSAYNFSAFGHVVDIGGGQGAMIAAVLAAHTNTHGILFDRPDVVARAQPVLEAAGVAKRCAVVGGSFFETIPEGGDAYLLKYILHDWDDAASLAILAACRRVFHSEAKLLIIERIVGGPNDGLETKTSDLNMLVSPDGQERTADEFAALLANAGFRMERIIEVTPRLSIVEAAPI